MRLSWALTHLRSDNIEISGKFILFYCFIKCQFIIEFITTLFILIIYTEMSGNV